MAAERGVQGLVAVKARLFLPVALEVGDGSGDDDRARYSSDDGIEGALRHAQDVVATVAAAAAAAPVLYVGCEGRDRRAGHQRGFIVHNIRHETLPGCKGVSALDIPKVFKCGRDSEAGFAVPVI